MDRLNFLIKPLIALFVVVVFAWAVVVSRYQYYPVIEIKKGSSSSVRGVFFRTDRLTGAIEMCTYNETRSTNGVEPWTELAKYHGSIPNWPKKRD